MERLLITGSDGFAGAAVCARLRAEGHAIRTVSRSAGSGEHVRLEIGPETDWATALDGVDTVVHLAARAHVLREMASNPIKAFRQVNADGTRRLAEACGKAAVRRVVYVSSIGVHGANTRDEPFTASSPIKPASLYAQSKWEGEEAIREEAQSAGFEWVVIRPPLMHGPGVKGNFLRLLQWVERGVPLPFAAVQNRRSFLGVENFADLILRCCHSDAAANETFVACDGEDVSTPELLERIGRGLGRRARSVAVPAISMRWAARLAGRGEDIDRLLGSLQVDDARTRQALDWKPVKSLDEGLAAMCRWYLEAR